MKMIPRPAVTPLTGTRGLHTADGHCMAYAKPGVVIRRVADVARGKDGRKRNGTNLLNRRPRGSY